MTLNNAMSSAHMCLFCSWAYRRFKSLWKFKAGWAIWGSKNLNKTTSKILSSLSIIFAQLRFALMEAR